MRSDIDVLCSAQLVARKLQISRAHDDDGHGVRECTREGLWRSHESTHPAYPRIPQDQKRICNLQKREVSCHDFEMVGQPAREATRRRWTASGTIAYLLLLAVTSCSQSGNTQATRSASAPPPAPEVSRGAESSGRDLSVDEAMGGHTLARHVGKSDAELRDRLRREPQISSASTYSDRATAEAVVGAAMSSAGRPFDAWRNRTGRRPNFVLHFAAHHVIGRSVARGQLEARPCEDALVVIRWDDRRRQYYVLTSYPEGRR